MISIGDLNLDYSSEWKNVLETISVTKQDARLVEPQEVKLLFKDLCTKATGPDGISAFLLKTCTEELIPAWCPIFQKSVHSNTIPVLEEFSNYTCT